MSNSRTRISLLLAATLLAVAACGGSTAARKSPTPSPSATFTPGVPTPTPTPAPLSAPLLVQVENLYQARPQSGLGDAQVIYEYQTEGGISRFTAIYFGAPPAADMVGPVRSARLVDLRLLEIWDGALLYSGASDYTLAQLNSSGLKQYSPNNAVVGSTVLFRTSVPPPAREYGAPHNLYTNGSELATLAQKIGLGTVSYQLWQRTAIDDLPTGGSAVSAFEVPISTEETPIYTYEAATGEYQRSEPATPEYPATGMLNDANTGQPWETPNVVILQVPVITVPQDNEDSAVTPWVDGLDFGIGPAASGSGQLAVGGLLYPISWSQGTSGPPQFTLADGQPAPLAAGQVTIELVPQGDAVTPSAPAAP
jgi:hypothetical protein